MPIPATFAHVAGTLNNIDELPGLKDHSRHELESWASVDRENRLLLSNRRGADHGDSLPRVPVKKRRKKRTWESPVSFEHEDAYDMDADPFMKPSVSQRTEQRVMCSFRIHDGNKAFRQALITCICTCGETYEWIRRLGLPKNSLRNKLPYHRCVRPATYSHAHVLHWSTSPAKSVGISYMALFVFLSAR